MAKRQIGAKRGRPPSYVWGEDLHEDVRRALMAVRPLPRGELKKLMASEPGAGRSQKWEERKKAKALLIDVDRKIMYRIAGRGLPVYLDECFAEFPD
jgi:hypothetical protein